MSIKLLILPIGLIIVLMLIYSYLNIQDEIMPNYGNFNIIHNNIGNKTSDIESFKLLYNRTSMVLHNDYNKLIGCLNAVSTGSDRECYKTDRNVYKSYYTKHYCFKNRHKPWNKSVYTNWTLNYKVLISENNTNKEEKDDDNNITKQYYDLIFGTPNAPHRISSRITIRNTWGNYKYINNLTMKHLFFMGRPENEIYNRTIPLKYLEIENSIYKDIVLFDVINNYKYLTLNVILFYNYILKYYNFKYFIRVDDDVSLKIKLLPNLIFNKFSQCEIIGYSKNEPKGPFQILQYSIVDLMNSSSYYVRPFSDAEDLYHGIVYRYHNKSHCKLTKHKEYTHYYYYLKIKELNSIAVHQIPSSVMIYYWNRDMNNSFLF